RRWIDYMLQYQFDITYVKGELNKVADCLSRYFESDTQDDMHDIHDFVQADKRIDPEGKDLPLHRFHEIVEHQVEIRAMQAHEVRHSKRLKEQLELQDLEAQHMLEAPMVGAQPVGEPLSDDNDPSVAQVLGNGNTSASAQEHDNAHLHARIQQGYLWDKMFVKILDQPREHF
ncbi:hypothetical protein C0995_003163, partial [Termitomyces sp. Mi166